MGAGAEAPALPPPCCATHAAWLTYQAQLSNKQVESRTTCCSALDGQLEHKPHHDEQQHDRHQDDERQVLAEQRLRRSGGGAAQLGG